MRPHVRGLMRPHVRRLASFTGTKVQILTLQVALQTLGGKEREAQAIRPQLQRLQTLFQFRSVEIGGRRQKGGGAGGGGGGGLGGSCGDKVVAMRWLSCSYADVC
jgi:hypothetical protein